MKKVKKIQYTRLADRKARVIQFVARTYAQITAAYEKLKSRYKKTVKLGKLIATGAGLYSGSFQIS